MPVGSTRSSSTSSMAASLPYRYNLACRVTLQAENRRADSQLQRDDPHHTTGQSHKVPKARQTVHCGFLHSHTVTGLSALVLCSKHSRSCERADVVHASLLCCAGNTALPPKHLPCVLTSPHTAATELMLVAEVVPASLPWWFCC